jgi:hypothetical protein
MLWALGSRDKGEGKGAGQQAPGSACVGQQWPRLSLAEDVCGSQTQRKRRNFCFRGQIIASRAAKSDSTEGPRPPGQDIPALPILKCFNLKGRF